MVAVAATTLGRRARSRSSMARWPRCQRMTAKAPALIQKATAVETAMPT